MQSRVPPRQTESESLGVRPPICVLTRPAGASDCTDPLANVGILLVTHSFLSAFIHPTLKEDTKPETILSVSRAQLLYLPLPNWYENALQIHLQIKVLFPRGEFPSCQQKGRFFQDGPRGLLREQIAADEMKFHSLHLTLSWEGHRGHFTTCSHSDHTSVL